MPRRLLFAVFASALFLLAVSEYENSDFARRNQDTLTRAVRQVCLLIEGRKPVIEDRFYIENCKKV
jgi:hypothetical protein